MPDIYIFHNTDSYYLIKPEDLNKRTPKLKILKKNYDIIKEYDKIILIENIKDKINEDEYKKNFTKYLEKESDKVSEQLRNIQEDLNDFKNTIYHKHNLKRFNAGLPIAAYYTIIGAALILMPEESIKCIITGAAGITLLPSIYLIDNKIDKERLDKNQIKTIQKHKTINNLIKKSDSLTVEYQQLIKSP